MLCLALLCLALLCIALPCHAKPCSALHCLKTLLVRLGRLILVTGRSPFRLTLQCDAMLCPALPCYALPCAALPCCTVRRSALHYWSNSSVWDNHLPQTPRREFRLALQCFAVLYAAMRCPALQCSALLCSALKLIQQQNQPVQNDHSQGCGSRSSPQTLLP